MKTAIRSLIMVLVLVTGSSASAATLGVGTVAKRDQRATGVLVSPKKIDSGNKMAPSLWDYVREFLRRIQ
jgi:hypothetical protein